jgi:hypothetical protein
MAASRTLPARTRAWVFAALNSVEPPIEKAWLGNRDYLESCFTAGDL